MSTGSTCASALGTKNHSPWRTRTLLIRRWRSLLRTRCSSMSTISGFSACLAAATVLTGLCSGMAATNQWRSSWPRRNRDFVTLPELSGTRAKSTRCLSLGCTSRTSTLTLSSLLTRKYSPSRSRRTSSAAGLTIRVHRWGSGSPNFTRAPIFRNGRSSLLALVLLRAYIGIFRFLSHDHCHGRNLTVNLMQARGIPRPLLLFFFIFFFFFFFFFFYFFFFFL